MPADDAYRTRLAEYANGTPAAEEPSCPDGQLPWRRGLDVNLCVTPCKADVDCASFERCVVVGKGEPPEPGKRRFANERPVQASEMARGVCDPFYDLEGALSAQPDTDLDTEADYGFPSNEDPTDAGR